MPIHDNPLGIPNVGSTFRQTHVLFHALSLCFYGSSILETCCGISNLHNRHIRHQSKQIQIQKRVNRLQKNRELAMALNFVTAKPNQDLPFAGSYLQHSNLQRSAGWQFSQWQWGDPHSSPCPVLLGSGHGHCELLAQGDCEPIELGI